MSQLALPLAWGPDPGDDGFLVGPSNERAVRTLDDWTRWPVRTALLVGPPRSGRSLLSRVFTRRSGAVVMDDAERAPEDALFHAWNRAEAANRPLLLVAAAALLATRLAGVGAGQGGAVFVCARCSVERGGML